MCKVSSWTLDTTHGRNTAGNTTSQNPYELRNVVDDPSYARVVEELKLELYRLWVEWEDPEDPF